jgi:hypothetical protein
VVIRRLFTAVFVILAFFAIISTPAAGSTIAWDGFESGNGAGGGGWMANWAFDGNAIVYNGGLPHGGTYHLMLQYGDGVASRTVDMTIVTAAHLRFWWKATSFEPGETAAIEVYDGMWHTVLTVNDGQDDGDYHLADINLSSYNMVSDFKVKAASDMNSSTDYFYVDDIAILGTLPQFIISGTITCSGLEVNEVNLMGLGVVTDANGFYTTTVDQGWSWTVTPAKYGYTFDPNSRTYTSVTSDLTVQDYNALPADDFNDNRRGSMWRHSH